MTFAKTIKRVISAPDKASFDSQFQTGYSPINNDQRNMMSADAFAPSPTQTVMTGSASADTMQTVRDSMFPFSQASDYAAITDGLAYLSRVATADAQSGSKAPAMFGTPVEAVNLKGMSKNDGVNFVKSALSFGVIDQTQDGDVRARATNFAERIFGELQAQTFNPGSFFDDGKRIAQTVYSNIISNTLGDVLGGVASAVSLFDSARGSQLAQIFGGIGMGAPQARLSDLGRMPEVKFRFLFYCDLYLWDGTVHRLMSVKSITGAVATFEQDTVNFYGLRSTVNKSMKYNNATLVLHDEIENATSTMFFSLLGESTGAFGNSAEQQQRELWRIAGDTDKTSLTSGTSTIPSTVTLNEENGIIKAIKTTQVYMQGRRCVRDIHTYLNPKIVTMTKSDFDMDNNTEAHNLTLEISYDALNVQLGIAESLNWRSQRDREWTSGSSPI